MKYLCEVFDGLFVSDMPMTLMFEQVHQLIMRDFLTDFYFKEGELKYWRFLNDGLLVYIMQD